MAGALAAQQALSQQPVDPPLVDMPRRVFEITGANPRECGRHSLRSVNGRFEGATRQALEASLQCARDAIKSGRPFWTFVERRGIDSWIAHGILRTAGGDLRFFAYDAAPCGGPGCQPTLSLESCREPAVKPAADGDEPDFTCR